MVRDAFSAIAGDYAEAIRSGSARRLQLDPNNSYPAFTSWESRIDKFSRDYDGSRSSPLKLGSSNKSSWIATPPSIRVGLASSAGCALGNYEVQPCEAAAACRGVTGGNVSAHPPFRVGTDRASHMLRSERLEEAQRLSRKTRGSFETETTVSGSANWAQGESRPREDHEEVSRRQLGIWQLNNPDARRLSPH